MPLTWSPPANFDFPRLDSFLFSTCLPMLREKLQDTVSSDNLSQVEGDYWGRSWLKEWLDLRIMRPKTLKHCWMEQTIQLGGYRERLPANDRKWLVRLLLGFRGAGLLSASASAISKKNLSGAWFFCGLWYTHSLLLHCPHSNVYKSIAFFLLRSVTQFPMDLCPIPFFPCRGEKRMAEIGGKVLPAKNVKRKWNPRDQSWLKRLLRIISVSLHENKNILIYTTTHHFNNIMKKKKGNGSFSNGTEGQSLGAKMCRAPHSCCPSMLFPSLFLLLPF